MAKKFTQGVYKFNNPDKYIGDHSKCVYRSSYELEMHQFLDNNSKVLRWGSEIVVVPYLKPTTGRIHRYFVDYYVEFVDKEGNFKCELIEVKPRSQTKAPRRSKTGKVPLYEKIQLAVNMAKWAAAKQYAGERGWGWRVITERSIFK